MFTQIRCATPMKYTRLFKKQIEVLIERVKTKVAPFDLSDIHQYYELYKTIYKSK